MFYPFCTIVIKYGTIISDRNYVVFVNTDNTNGHEACAGLIPIFLKRTGRLHPRKEAVIRVNTIVRDKVKEKL